MGAWRCSVIVPTVVLASGCATTARVCPVGTQLHTAQRPDGRAQWCTTSDRHLAALPVPGRTQESTLALDQPGGMPGGMRGPYTKWHANGTMAAHGHYSDFGARSVPDGLWASWYPNGQRRTLGRYRRGEPDGCFATWDETGVRATGFVEAGQLRVAACTPPADDELAHSEAPEAVETKSGDVSLQGFIGPGSIGARNELQIDPDPALRVALAVTARKYLGRLRVGPLGGIRFADNSDYRVLVAGATVGFALPRLHRRVDAEVSADLAAQYVTAVAMRPMQPGTASLAFWSPLGAAQLGVAFQLSPTVEVLAAARVDGVPARTVSTDVVYCDVVCRLPQQEMWRVGGFAYGVNLGVRLVIR